MKIKIAALLALCVFLSGIAGINSASATDSTTFTNVDLKNGEILPVPSYSALEIKGIQFPDKVGLRVRWDRYSEQNYTVKVSISYDDLFGDFSTQDYYFYVDSETGSMADYWDIPYMDIDKDNTITIQILPDDEAN